MARRLLVLATADVPRDAIRRAVRENGGADAEVLVVAPAVGVSRLEWLANDEDAARADAERRAREVAEQAPAGAVEARVGDSDPVLAIEDALRTFPADELLVVTHRDGEAGWLEEGTAESALERFALPVRQVVVAGDG